MLCAAIGFLVGLTAAGAESAVESCISGAPRAFNAHDKAELCANALSDAPAACAKKLSSNRKLSHLAIALCAGATSHAPSSCFKASSSLHGLKDSMRVSLCRAATSDVPVKCVKEVSRASLSQEMAIDLCKQSTSTDPSKCVKAAKSELAQ